MPEPAALNAFYGTKVLGEDGPDPGMDHLQPSVRGGGIPGGPADGKLCRFGPVVAHSDRSVRVRRIPR